MIISAFSPPPPTQGAPGLSDNHIVLNMSPEQTQKPQMSPPHTVLNMSSPQPVVPPTTQYTPSVTGKW